MGPTVLHPFNGDSLRCKTGLGPLAHALCMPILDETIFYLGVDETSHDLLVEAVVIMPSGQMLSSGVRTIVLHSDAWIDAQWEAEGREEAYIRDERQLGPLSRDVGYAFEPLIELIERQHLWGLLIGLVVQLAASAIGLVPAAHLLKMSTTHEASTADGQGRRIANPRPINESEDGALFGDDDLLPF